MKSSLRGKTKGTYIYQSFERKIMMRERRRRGGWWEVESMPVKIPW